MTRFIQRVVNLRGSPYGTGQEPVLAGSGWAGTNERFASGTPGAHRLAPVHRRDAAALLDGPFAQPAGNCHTDPAHELIVMYCATIECFRSVLDAVGSFIRTRDERRFTNDG